MPRKNHAAREFDRQQRILQRIDAGTYTHPTTTKQAKRLAAAVAYAEAKRIARRLLVQAGTEAKGLKPAKVIRNDSDLLYLRAWRNGRGDIIAVTSPTITGISGLLGTAIDNKFFIVNPADLLPLL